VGALVATRAGRTQARAVGASQRGLDLRSLPDAPHKAGVVSPSGRPGITPPGDVRGTAVDTDTMMCLAFTALMTTCLMVGSFIRGGSRPDRGEQVMGGNCAQCHGAGWVIYDAGQYAGGKQACQQCGGAPGATA
jgi:hypothetical protein